jgi:hypothetical protein
MDSADCAAPGSESWKPWPTRSGAEVVFLPGERAAAERVATRLFHRPLDTWEYAGLAGAPDDAKVEVGASAGKLYIELGDPVAAAYRAYYYVRRAEAQLVLANDGFHVHLRGWQGRGFGLHVFHRQVASASALGIHRIETVAGRRRDENGYYTWPRFGFESILPARLRRILPIGLEHARTVLDLMECEKGRAWWREHGETIGVVFDLTPGSRSRRTLEQYVRTKTNSRSGTKTNLEKRAAMVYIVAR